MRRSNGFRWCAIAGGLALAMPGCADAVRVESPRPHTPPLSVEFRAADMGQYAIVRNASSSALQIRMVRIEAADGESGEIQGSECRLAPGETFEVRRSDPARGALAAAGWVGASVFLPLSLVLPLAVGAALSSSDLGFDPGDRLVIFANGYDDGTEFRVPDP